MGADLSRMRFDARRDHAGVVMQQGRLLLDADWNELVAILQRRIAAGSLDLASEPPTAGIAGVAFVPRTTPDAFKVTLAAGALTIGRGRMYVDGLLAENHGVGPSTWEPMLAELTGTLDTPYDAQPYQPEPAPLPTTGSHLAYLDVWQRELTHLEAPDLIEPAVGVDTTARTQTVWQVKLHPLDAAGITCSTPDADIPGWSEVIAPSGGRLTVGTIEVGDEDPCELPPSGGFRGLEHQTYRVEIHDGGAPGTATFVWSRENGSVAFPVLEVLSAGTVLRPASLGKDPVLGLSDGDWVEVTDDRRVLAGEPGELRRIEVHDEDGTLTVAPALPVALRLNATQAADRHLIVRRWDQKGVVRTAGGAQVVDLGAAAATGAIPVPSGAATKVVLEFGLVVSFSTTGAPFRPGDHWIFPARAADAAGGPIAPDEPALTAAPPVGIHHHYARLGILAFPDDETDCRTPWPDCDCEGGDCGDCTVCVTPESHASGTLTIQAAVDQVKEAGGGTVCIAIGLYRLEDDGVLIEGASSVRVRGQGLRTILLAPGAGIRVRSSAYVTVENLTVFASGALPAVHLHSTAVVSVRDVTALMLRPTDALPAVSLTGIALRTSLVDNVVIGVVGVGGAAGDPVALLTADLEATGNVLLCRDVGVALDGVAVHLLGNRFAGNTVLRAREAGIRVRGAVVPGGGVAVDDNSVVVGGTGIAVGTAGFAVTGNDVAGTPESIEAVGDGIAVLPATGKLRGRVRIDDNRVADVGGRGIGVLAPVGALDIAGNSVERAQHGIVMDGHAIAESVAVVHNTVTDVGSRATDEIGGVTGVRVTGAQRATVESNIVHGVGSAREAIGRTTGIDVLACLESRVAGNSVDRVGFPTSGGDDTGIAVRGRIRRTQVDANASRRQPTEPDDEPPMAFQGLVIGADAHPVEPGAVSIGPWIVGTGALTWAIGPLLALAAAPAPAAVVVDSNVISGSGERPAALIGVGGDVIVTSNHVHQREEAASAALRVVAQSASVGQNRLRGGRPSGQVDVDPKRIAVVGNLSSLGIEVFGNPLDPPWSGLNPAGF